MPAAERDIPRAGVAPDDTRDERVQAHDIAAAAADRFGRAVCTADEGQGYSERRDCTYFRC